MAGMNAKLNNVSQAEEQVDPNDPITPEGWGLILNYFQSLPTSQVFLSESEVFAQRDSTIAG